MKTIAELSSYLQEKRSEHDGESLEFSPWVYACDVAIRKLQVIRNITPEGFIAAIQREVRGEAKMVKGTATLTPEKQTVKQWVSSSLAILLYFEIIEWMEAEERKDHL